ncbi:hypothetical protein CCR91_00730 [Thiorhodovibrio winogradskyi]|nr:hypothetical protein [Thiorhodovibrio winogradskyi]
MGQDGDRRRVRQAQVAGLKPLAQRWIEGIDVSAELIPRDLTEAAVPGRGDGDASCPGPRQSRAGP